MTASVQTTTAPLRIKAEEAADGGWHEACAAVASEGEAETRVACMTKRVCGGWLWVSVSVRDERVEFEFECGLQGQRVMREGEQRRVLL